MGVKTVIKAETKGKKQVTNADLAKKGKKN